MSEALPAKVVVAIPSLGSLARDAVLETSNREEAVAALLKRVQGKQSLIRELVRAGAADFVRAAATQLRTALEVDYLGGREKGLISHTAALRGRAKLYDWKLPVTGKPIGEATVLDLSDAADWHAGRSEFELARSQMYRAVQQRLARSNHKTVIEGISESDLAQIMQAAEPGAD
jgi:hypothetical protein